MSSSTGKLIHLQRLIELRASMTTPISRILRDGWPPDQAHQELLRPRSRRRARGQGMPDRTAQPPLPTPHAGGPRSRALFLLDMDGTFYLGESLLPGALSSFRCCGNRGATSCS